MTTMKNSVKTLLSTKQNKMSFLGKVFKKYIVGTKSTDIVMESGQTF